MKKRVYFQLRVVYITAHFVGIEQILLKELLADLFFFPPGGGGGGLVRRGDVTKNGAYFQINLIESCINSFCRY